MRIESQFATPTSTQDLANRDSLAWRHQLEEALLAMWFTGKHQDHQTGSEPVQVAATSVLDQRQPSAQASTPDAPAYPIRNQFADSAALQPVSQRLSNPGDAAPHSTAPSTDFQSPAVNDQQDASAVESAYAQAATDAPAHAGLDAQSVVSTAPQPTSDTLSGGLDSASGVNLGARSDSPTGSTTGVTAGKDALNAMAMAAVNAALPVPASALTTIDTRLVAGPGSGVMPSAFDASMSQALMPSLLATTIGPAPGTEAANPVLAGSEFQDGIDTDPIEGQSTSRSSFTRQASAAPPTGEHALRCIWNNDSLMVVISDPLTPPQELQTVASTLGARLRQSGITEVSVLGNGRVLYRHVDDRRKGEAAVASPGPILAIV